MSDPPRTPSAHGGGPGLVADLLADGRGLLSVTTLGLMAAGGFAWFLALTGELLPHDVAWLAISEAALRGIADGRVIDFMAHDRAAFGGTLVAVGIVYLWLIRFPLTDGQAWAWWTLAISGALGFLSFLSYLGTGYLDTWHGVASLVILPPFVLGLIRTHATLRAPRGPRSLLAPGSRPVRYSRAWAGRLLLLLTAFGMVAAGLTILAIGTFVVFVPEDLELIGLTTAELEAIDPRLIPLIAHDRAGFGGGLATAGVLVFASVYCGRPSRALWEALLLAGIAGFGAAIGVHLLVGYLHLIHLGPAYLGAAAFVAAILLSRPAMLGSRTLDMSTASA
jgi:hypothetical protein